MKLWFERKPMQCRFMRLEPEFFHAIGRNVPTLRYRGRDTLWAYGLEEIIAARDWLNKVIRQIELAEKEGK